MKKQTKTILIAVASAIVVVLAGLYIYRGVHYQNRYLPQTKVENVDISKLTYAQAKAKLQHHLVATTYHLYEKKQQRATVTGKKLGLAQDSNDSLKQLLHKQNSWSLANLATVHAEKQTDVITVDEQKLTAFVQTEVKKLNQNRTTTKNASVTKKDDQVGFKIKPEVYGNRLNESKVKKLLLDAIAHNQTKVQLTKAYDLPTVKKTDKALTKQVQALNKVANVTGTYQISGHTEQITPKMITGWLSYDDDQVQIDQNALSQYLTNLNAKFGTYNKTRQFKSTKRGTVSVPAGIYGWSINITSELSKLNQALLAGKNFTRTPIIQGSGYHKDGTDIGSTYIEIDKTNQHMWVYVNGSLKISTDVVTGKPGQDTPSGVYSVWSKQRNATLRGNNDDGSKYASKVSYWMPIDNTGVGIHDSPWQKAYGGKRYVKYGSHGCINTPPSVMAKVYATVSLQTPVLVF